MADFRVSRGCMAEPFPMPVECGCHGFSKFNKALYTTYHRRRSSQLFHDIERHFSQRAMEGDSPPPSLPWRFGSATVMGVSGFLTRTFMYGANSMETHGLDGFLNLVDERQDIDKRQRGLITGECSLLLGYVSYGLTLGFPVSNHISVYVRITACAGFCMY